MPHKSSEERKKYARQWYREHKARWKGYYSKYLQKHGTEERERKRQLRQEKRLLVVQAYGGKCVCCGYSDISKVVHGKGFLEIDHINGGGNREIRRLRMDFYTYLKQNGFPFGYRVLCAGCNAAMEPGAEKCELHKEQL